MDHIVVSDSVGTPSQKVTRVKAAAPGWGALLKERPALPRGGLNASGCRTFNRDLKS